MLAFGAIANKVLAYRSIHQLLGDNYKAGSIVLPKLGDMREILQSEIQVIAEQKFQLISHNDINLSHDDK